MKNIVHFVVRRLAHTHTPRTLQCKALNWNYCYALYFFFVVVGVFGWCKWFFGLDANVAHTHPIARSFSQPTTTEYAKFYVIVCWPLPLFHSSLHIHKFWVFAVKCIERRHEFVIFRWCINRYGGQCVSRTFAARHSVSCAPPAATSNHGGSHPKNMQQPRRIGTKE